MTDDRSSVATPGGPRGAPDRGSGGHGIGPGNSGVAFRRARSGAYRPGPRVPAGHLLRLLVALSSLTPGALGAQFVLFQGESNGLQLGGYFNSLTGLHDRGFNIPDEEAITGFNAEVLRLKWTARFGDRAILEAHNRFQIQASSSSSVLGGPAAGFGVSVIPGRSLDLSTVFIDQDRLRVWHDVDRLSLTVYTGAGDLTLGRQAVTWGVSNLFPVADLWTQFSPFELDTEEKPGIDAVRFLSYPTGGLELDAVLADRGAVEDLSVGVRASMSLPGSDLYLAGGKFWNEAMVLGGVAAPVGSWKLRAEGVLPYDLDDDELDLPRATLGVDRMGGELMLSGEYHFNGIGAAEVEGYGEAIRDPRYARGESYFLGRHYFGAFGAWTPGNDRLSLGLSAMVSLVDGSTVLSPSLTYDFGQETRLSLGGFLSSGAPPVLEPVPEIESEYGLYGDLLYTTVYIFF